jgi:hypothetical protein
VAEYRISALKDFRSQTAGVLSRLVGAPHIQAAWRNAGRMFYLRSEAYGEAMKTERQSGIKYDYFLYVREDNMFVQPLNLHSLIRTLSGPLRSHASGGSVMVSQPLEV